MTWRQRAACLGEDPELFYPSGVTGPALDQVERAKKVCAACEVRADCLEWALEARQDGVWGGTTTEERAAIRRKRRKREAG